MGMIVIAVSKIWSNLFSSYVIKEKVSMKNSVLIPVAVVALMVGLGFGTTAMAEHASGKGGGHHGMMHGDYQGHHGPSWKDSLTDAQKLKIDKMKVDYLKVKYPLKARIKTIKIDLAVLASADAPDQKAIDAKIDELLALKKDLLKAKYAHKTAVRKELKPEQKVLFDKHMLKKAKRKKCQGHHG